MTQFTILIGTIMNILGSPRILPRFLETHCGMRDPVTNPSKNINRKEEEGAAHIISCLPYAASKIENTIT